MSYQSRYSRRQQSEVADIGVIPAIADPQRRAKCRLSLADFLVTYFPATTGLSPFSDDHLRVIARIESCILSGGRYANVVYRGFAKTTIAQNAAIWATIYAHRRFVAVFGADATAANGSLDSIKMELAENELLYQDFPEVCHAIWALEGKPQRCKSQTHIPGNIDGFQPATGAESKQTHIRWTAEKIVYPTIVLPDGPAPSSGAIITCRGVTGGSRGLNYKRADGTQQRPDFVLLDDPQTDDSASTDLQVRNRLSIIKKAILKLGGHNKQLAVVMNATPIQLDDVVEQLLDPVRNPSWQSERIPMVRKWADAHETLWLDKYAKTRNSYDPDVIGDQKRAHDEATELYRTNRAAMDAGCVVSWEHCFDREAELSAIQHAYNALIDDGEEVFQSEFQCRPLAKEKEDAGNLIAKDIAKRVNGTPRGVAPIEATRLTAFIDVQQSVLFYAVCGWGDGFDGYVIDYGTFPDQGTNNVSLRKLRRTLAQSFPNTGVEGAIHAGILALSELLGREWIREDGASMRIDRLMIDSGYASETVYSACRASKMAAVIIPSKGFAITARGVPFSEWSKKPGEKFGTNFVVSPTGRGRMLCKYDANYWKTFVSLRMKTSPGDPGALTLFGKSSEAHETIALHCTAERPVQTTGRGRTIDEWVIRPEKPDNHWWDCLVGCTVGASMQGASLSGIVMNTQRSSAARPTLAQLKARK